MKKDKRKGEEMKRCEITNKLVKGKRVVIVDNAEEYVKKQGKIVLTLSELRKKMQVLLPVFIFIFLIVMIPAQYSDCSIYGTCKKDGNFTFVSGNGSSGGSGNLTGGGLLNQVAFWTGISFLGGDDLLYWNNSAKKLGIGVTPLYRLHVKADSPNPSGAENFVVFEDHNSNTQFFSMNKGGDTAIGQSSEGGIKFLVYQSQEGEVVQRNIVEVNNIGGGGMAEFSTASAIQTFDSNPTQMSSLPYRFANSILTVEAQVFGYSYAGNDFEKSNAYTLIASFRYDQNTGELIQIGTTTKVHEVEEVPDWDATIELLTGVQSLHVLVTGDDNNEVMWTAYCTIYDASMAL